MSGAALLSIVEYEIARRGRLTRVVRDAIDGCFEQKDSMFLEYHRQATRMAAKAQNTSLLAYLIDGPDRLDRLDQDILALLCQDRAETDRVDLETVKLLLAYGAQVDGVDSYGKTAVYYACVNGWRELFEVLVTAGADLTKRFTLPQRYRQMPLTDQPRDLLSIIAFVVDSSGTVLNYWRNTYDRWGPILLQIPGQPTGQLSIEYAAEAAGRGDNKAVLAFLGACSRQDYSPPLRAAAEHGRVDTVRLLLDLGADPAKPSLAKGTRRQYDWETEITPVAAAVRAGCISACELLYEAGISRDDKVMLLVPAVEHNRSLAERLWNEGVRTEAPPPGAPPATHLWFQEKGLSIDWTAVQSHAFDHGNLRQLADVAGPYIRSENAFVKSIQKWWPFDDLHKSTVMYLLQKYSKIPHTGLVDVFARILLRFPPRFLLMFLQEGAICPGTRAAAKAALMSLEPNFRPNSWFVLDEDQIRKYQILAQCVDEALNVVNEHLWLHPDDLYDWIKGHREELSSLMARPVPLKLVSWRRNDHLPIEDDPETNAEESHRDVVIEISEVHVPFKPTPLPRSNIVYDKLSLGMFRLLTLYSDMSCKLSTHILKSAPPYEALSYVWGSGHAQITVDDTVVSIRSNLYSALDRLRSDRPRTLWVDALCINQEDSREKAQQVQGMRYLYSGAVHVIVWLGEADEASRSVSQYVQKADEALRSVSQHARDGRLPKAPQHWSHDSYQGSIRDAYLKLCARAWYFRTWTLQEYALSKKAIVVCGDDAAEWNTLLRPDLSSRDGTWNALDGVHTETRVRILTTINRYPQTSGILEHATLCEASDLRDKVFSLLGLLDYDIPVDYTKSVTEVYTTFSKHLIAEEGLQVLHVYNRKQLSLPSWVADLSAVPIGSLGQNESMSSDEATTLLSKSLDLKFDDDKMTLRGIRIGRIAETAPVLGSHHKPGSSGYRQAIRDWEVLACKCERMPYAFFSLLLTRRKHGMRWCLSGAQWHEKYCSGLLKERYPDFWNDAETMLRWDQHVVGRPDSRDADTFAASMSDSCYGRRFFTTEGGGMGLGSELARAGDEIVFFPGAKHPFTLRRSDAGETYILGGDCFVFDFDQYRWSVEEINAAEEFVIS